MRISASARRLSMGLRRPAPVQQQPELRLDAIERRVQHLAARHDDDGAHFSRGCYSQTGRPCLAFPREHRHEATRPLEPCLVNQFEVRSLAHMLAREEAMWAWGLGLG